MIDSLAHVKPRPHGVLLRRLRVDDIEAEATRWVTEADPTIREAKVGLAPFAVFEQGDVLCVVSFEGHGWMVDPDHPLVLDVHLHRDPADGEVISSRLPELEHRMGVDEIRAHTTSETVDLAAFLSYDGWRQEETFTRLHRLLDSLSQEGA